MAADALVRCGGSADACLECGYAMFQAPSLGEVTPCSGGGDRATLSKGLAGMTTIRFFLFTCIHFSLNLDVFVLHIDEDRIVHTSHHFNWSCHFKGTQSFIVDVF